MAGEWHRAKGDETRRIPRGGVDGCGGGVPIFLLPDGVGLNGLFLGLSTLLLTDGVRLDFDLCIPIGLFGLEDPSPIEDKFPVDVADFSLQTSGFSGATGLGILESHGRFGDGGCTTGDFMDERDVGPAMMPSATCLMSLLHLSHKFKLFP